MAHLESPQIPRNISRIVVCLAILSSLVFVWYQSSFEGKIPQVLGTENNDDGVDVWQEIEKTRAIIEKRPDYAAAWLRLAVLYEQIGELQLAGEARDYAGRLNPDLAP